MRFFNTEGPIRSDLHYCLPPLHCWNLDDVLTLIARQKYFLLHAPRQTGKTTCLLALMAHLNREGRYRAVYANLEIAQTAREDVARGMRAICGALASAARLYGGKSGYWARSKPPGRRVARKACSTNCSNAGAHTRPSRWCCCWMK